MSVAVQTKPAWRNNIFWRDLLFQPSAAQAKVVGRRLARRVFTKPCFLLQQARNFSPLKE